MYQQIVYIYVIELFSDIKKWTINPQKDMEKNEYCLHC